MSSILDALKKVEQEKADANRPDDPGFRHETAEQDLLGGQPVPSSLSLRITPALAAAGAIALTGLVVGISVTLSVLLARPIPAPAPVVLTPPAPQPQPVSTVPITPPPAEPVAQPASQPSFSTPAPAPPVAATVPAPPANPPAPTVPVQMAAPAAKTEKSAPPKKFIAKNTSPQTPESSKPDSDSIEPRPLDAVSPETGQTPPSPAKTAPRREPIPVDLMTLPVLRESDKERLGLGDIRINMVRPANRAHPYASAIINLQPVHIGERIADTCAVLIGVDTRSVAIEIEGTGERFHIRF